MRKLAGTKLRTADCMHFDSSARMESADSMTSEVTMRVTAPLPADKGPYIFVCHPHGNSAPQVLFTEK